MVFSRTCVSALSAGMGKTSTKLAVIALALQLLLHLSAVIAKVDFVFYESPAGCDGAGYFYDSVPPNVCVLSGDTDWGSMASFSRYYVSNFFYGPGGCTTLRYQYKGNVCMYGGGYSGASWSPAERKSRPGDDAETNEAARSWNVQTEPTGIAYSENGTKGHWILTTHNATDLYSQMGNIPYAQKVDWLRAHGATFEPGREMAVAAMGDVTVT